MVQKPSDAELKAAKDILVRDARAFIETQKDQRESHRDYYLDMYFEYLIDELQGMVKRG